MTNDKVTKNYVHLLHVNGQERKKTNVSSITDTILSLKSWQKG